MKKIIVIVAILLSNLLHASDLSRLIAREFGYGEDFCDMQELEFFAQKLGVPFDQKAVEKSPVCLAVSTSGERFPKGFVAYIGDQQGGNKITAFLVPLNDVAVIQKLMSKVLELGVKSLALEREKENIQETDLLCGQGFRVERCASNSQITYRWQKT